MSEPKTRVVFVGTVDVDARIELMQSLSPHFEMSAIGSAEGLKSRFEQAGFSYHCVAMSRGANPVGDLISYRCLIRLFRSLRPDVAHTFDTKPCVWGRLAARTAGVRVVVGSITGLGALYVDSDIRTRLIRAVYEPLQRLACHRSDMTIFYNRDDAGEFAEAGIVPPDRSAIVPGSGIRTDQFSQENISPEKRSRVKEEAGLRNGELVVTMIARVCKSKGVLEFARAADLVSSWNPRVRFLLVGPEDRDVMDKLSAEEKTKVRNSVTCLGERKDIAAILAVTDICALPSYYREGIPRVLIEAASMSLPLITTDAPGCREVVHDGLNGILIRPRDAESLAQAVKQMAADEGLRRRYGSASRQRAVNEFDISIIAERVTGIYRSCLMEES